MRAGEEGYPRYLGGVDFFLRLELFLVLLL